MNVTPLKSEPPIAVLLGLPFHDVTLEETLTYCSESMEQEECRYLVTANVDFTMQAYHDADLRKIVFFANRVVCDGMPLVWLSKIFGYPLRERVAGSDMVPKLLEICAQKGHSVYFFGSDLNTLLEAKTILEERYPGLRVAGVDSPPIGAVVEWDNEELCEKMRNSGARLLLVCLGCPKQERWLFAHHKETGVPLGIGVGASLDFITGKQRRAPRWMQKSGTEWFWRMSGDPRRLVSRYAKDFVFLTKAAVRQIKSQRKRDKIGTELQSHTATAQQDKPDIGRLSWRGSLEGGLDKGAPIPDLIEGPILLDASEVTFMDSSGLGRLALLSRKCRTAGKMFFLVNPSPAARQAVRAVRMDALFPIVANEAEAFDLLREEVRKNSSSQEGGKDTLKIAFNHALDALHHDEMLAVLETAIRENPGLRSLVLDLSEVEFIDSRAVGGLIRARRLMASRGGDLFLFGARPQVKEIIVLLRLDKVLPEWKGEVVA